MQVLSALSGNRAPNVTTLGGFTDKPSGVGATGYDATASPYKPAAPVNKQPAYGAGGNGPIAASPVGAAKAPAATSATPNTPARSTDPSQSIYSLDTDPIVAKIQALNTANYGSAEATAQAAAKTDLVNSGFSLADIIAQNPALASSPIGSVLGDQATSLAAQQNPYSTLAQLNEANNVANQGIDQTDNDNNLFYSSTRGNQLSDQSHAYLGNVAAARGSLADQLTQLITGLSSEQATENQNLADAYDTARENAVTNGVNSGEVLLGYDGSGNPIFGAAPSATPAAGLNEAAGGPLDLTGFTGSVPGASFAATPIQLAAAQAAVAKKPAATKAPANAYLTSPTKRG